MKRQIVGIRDSLSIYIDEYVSWLILSFVVCAMPVLLSPLFAELTVAFSSLLAYSFALLGANVYLFDHLLSVSVDGGTLGRSRKEAARACMYGAVGVFVAYNLDGGFNELVNDHIQLAIGITAALVFVLTMSLAVPQINRNVEETRQTRILNQRRDSAKEVSEDAKSIRTILEKEEF